MESRKIVLMNLSAGHQWRHRHREQAYGHRAGGGEGGADGESSMDTDTLARVRYTARGLCCRLAIKPALGQPRGRHWVRGGRQVRSWQLLLEVWYFSMSWVAIVRLHYFVY